jgi:ATP-binding cassette, subfamily B, bacterial PglK
VIGCAKVQGGGGEAALVRGTHGDYEARFAIKKSIALLDTFRKLRSLLNPREQRQALLLLGLMLVVGLVEMAGVASIFPLIAVLSDPSLVQTNSWLRLAYEGLGFPELNAFFIFLSAAVFLIVLVRTSLTALSVYAILRFAAMRSYSLGTRLLETYLHRPYPWFLNRHSADLSKAVFSEVGEVVGGSIMPILQLISQSIIAACLIGLVVIIDPVVAMSAALVLTLAYGAIYLSVRGLLLRLGRQRVESNRHRFRIAQEALGGIKEVKVSGLENAYLRRFQSASLRFERTRSNLQALGDIPRFALEAIAIGGMLTVIMALLLRNEGSLAVALPSIAVYAFAGLRLLPVVQTLYKSIVTLRASGPALDKLLSELNDKPLPLPEGEPLRLNETIELDAVSFSYPQSEKQALNAISLEIPAKSTVGLVGKTGAGKSTLVDLMLGLLTPQSGELRIDGMPLTWDSVRAWQKSVGYVPQHIFLADESIAANIAFGVAPDRLDMASVERAAKMASLHQFVVSELPEGYRTRVGERGVRLSGGQRQRIGIARALYNNPDVLLLDEATSALDNATEEYVMSAIRGLSHEKTIIMIAHRLASLKDCDVIYEIDKGTVIAQHMPGDLLDGDETLAAFRVGGS